MTKEAQELAAAEAEKPQPILNLQRPYLARK